MKSMNTVLEKANSVESNPQSIIFRAAILSLLAGVMATENIHAQEEQDPDVEYRELTALDASIQNQINNLRIRQEAELYYCLYQELVKEEQKKSDNEVFCSLAAQNLGLPNPQNLTADESQALFNYYVFCVINPQSNDTCPSF